MSKKMHISWHDIELYLKEKVTKRELSDKKDHFIKELLELKQELSNYTNDAKVYEVELELYKERMEKNRDVLEGLIRIFPEDTSLNVIINDMNKK